MNLVEISPVLFAWLIVVLAIVALALGLLAVNRHRLLVRMRKSERSFRDLYDNISEGVFRSTLDGHMISANPALVRLNGFATEEEMLNEVNDIAGQWYVDPNRRAEIHRMLEENGKVTNVKSEVYRYKTRERIWIEESTRLVRDVRTGKPRHYDGTVREVTDTVRRLQLQQRYDKIASVVSGCFYTLRMWPDGRASFAYASEGMNRIFGIRPEEVVEDASIIAALVHPDDIERVRESFASAGRAMRPRQEEYRIRTLDGVEKWILTQSVPEAQADGSILWHGYFVDVSERKRAEGRIYDLAYRDTLTGLPNRSALVEGLQGTLLVGNGNQRWGALLFIDLDQFKVLNDTKGHHFGDRLLCGVAERLTPVVGEDDLVARLGGDEFVVIIKDVGKNQATAEMQTRQVADRIHAAIGDPFVLDRFPFHTSASIGAALFRGGDISVDELLKRADMAMYEAKAAGRGTTSIFAPEMQAELEEHLALTMDLRGALETGVLTLAYQPQVDDAGAWVGVEALLRWDHPVRGPIPPSVFIPLADRAGLGAQVDAFVLGAACATLRHWRNLPALNHLQMAVNVGSRRLDGALVALVTNAVRSAGVPASQLTIEITERVVLDNIAEVDLALSAIKKLGAKIALDDFGTGYSSLSHLKRLPIDMIKVDRSFVDEIETDSNDRVIVQTILNIARNLGVAAIAEGVENEMQALLLRRFGCRAYQGYLYGRPMSRDELEARMAEGGARRIAADSASRMVV
jgi:diguanylate cyclase (GGDEF)-like protein/PAS domain S-box-containing protein